MKPTILIVDDHPSFRTEARSMFERAGFDVVGEAADGEAAVNFAVSLMPDIVLLDVRLPDFDGFEVARRLTQQSSPPVVILVSTSEASDYGPRLASAPAAGFITKSELSVPRLRALAGIA